MKPFNNLPCINMAAVTRLHQPSSHCLKHAFIWELYQQAYLGRWWRVKQFLRKMTYPSNGVGLFCFVLFCFSKNMFFLLSNAGVSSGLTLYKATREIYQKQIRRTHSGLLPKGLECACVLRTTKCTFDTFDTFVAAAYWISTSTSLPKYCLELYPHTD